MRDAAHLSMSPEDYQAWQARKRAQILRDLLRVLEASRNEEWYVSTLEYCARRRAGIEASQHRGK